MLVYNSYEELANIGSRVRIEKRTRDGITSSCAFSDDDTLTLMVRVPRVYCAAAARLHLYRDDDMTNHSYDMPFVDFAEADDIFELTLVLHDICIGDDGGLFYYTVGLDTPIGELYTRRNGTLTPDRCGVDCTQLTVYKHGFSTPDRFKGGMMYQIFPDRFSKGGRYIEPSKGKIINHDWENGIPQYADVPGGEVANNMFFGGNLWGIADGLDYIQSLGVNILYLCPIFEAASNHRYDTGDYMKIDRLLGGEEAFDHLLAELKNRGMLLILDGVFNHTGADSRYFNKFGNYSEVGAYNSKESEYYKWYQFDEFPDEYSCWWGVKILPAVRSDEPSYLDFICGENGVIRHYLKKGIDGWRLDVADELSDVFLDKLRAAAKSERVDSIVFGEVWEDASNKVAYDKRRRYFRGCQLDSVMNYPLKDAVIEYVMTCNSSKLYETAHMLYTHYPKQVADVLMNFLGTHDTERILTVLADVGTDKLSNAELATYRLPTERREIAVIRLKLAWAILAAFPGIPCIYYGDECGMEGGHDPFNRLPFNAVDTKLTDFYRDLGSIRRAEKAFADGAIELYETLNKRRLLFTRTNGDETIAVCANLSSRVWELEFESEPIRLLGNQNVDGNIAEVEAFSVEYFKIITSKCTNPADKTVKIHEN
ncbi:MAG: glycoside hydrolase family 13 protein [Clostridiales bacterium]|nr:glycoside hydrolase family 13 protein [Clostridiales bacterium]